MKYRVIKYLIYLCKRITTQNKCATQSSQIYYLKRHERICIHKNTCTQVLAKQAGKLHY